MANDDWKPIEITGGDGNSTASGTINLDRAVETRPCMMCRSFEKDNTKLAQHLRARGLTPDAAGYFHTPIAKDFPGRAEKALKIYLPDYGYCRKECMPVDMQATCERWEQVRTTSELATRIR